jgi:DNA helicase-2/ATP-dependent DNA helicase PcrA
LYIPASGLVFLDAEEEDIMDLLTSLNPLQQSAVMCTEGPLLIMAGAGSGKTRVLVHRVAYLIKEIGVDPSRILAITFTNKAAGEMRERIEKLVGSGSQRMWIGTFHATCVRILRQDIHHLGFNRNFVIYDDSDQQTLIKKCLKELNLDEKKYTPRGMAAAIGNGKNKLWNAEKFRQRAGNFYEEKVAQVYQLYQKKLTENNALDFDDLIMKTVELFQFKPEVLRYYQHKFQYILVDEYQDTNHSQYRLIRMLAEEHRNLCVVGDPDQSIYRWRGADIQNILDFEHDYQDARVIRLEQNYRSTQNILDAANAVIRHNLGRKEKNLWTDQGRGAKIIYRVTEDERAEGVFVAEKVFQLHQQEGVSYRDCVVLYRTHAQSRALEEAFIKYKLPYRIYGGIKFYDRKEIKDTLAYLKVLMNPDDSVSLARIINEPKRGIGISTWDKVETYAARQEISIYAALGVLTEIEGLSPRAAKALKSFYDMMERLREKKDFSFVTQLVEEVWEATGYRRVLESDNSPEGESRLENLQEFLSVTEEFDQTAEEPTLENFLAQISLATDLDALREEDEAVTMMTLHTAKGLEFPVVFMVGLEEGIFPHGRAMLDEEEMEEERRLCYVGMTRAKERLFISRAYHRMLWGQSQFNNESRFMREIPAELLEEENGHNLVKGQEAHEKEPFFSGREKRTSSLMNLGDKVQHAKFGTGVIVKTDGSGLDMEISVAFPQQGIKTFILRYAPIKKI